MRLVRQTLNAIVLPMTRKSFWFTWATACGAPLNAAVETTLTAPPPSSRPSSGWSVTWTTRYVTCKTKDRLHKKDTLGKNIFCVLQSHIKKLQWSASPWLWIYLSCLYLFFSRACSPNVSGSRCSLHILKHKHICGGSDMPMQQNVSDSIWKQGREKWTYLFRESLFVFCHHVTLLLTDMWQQPRANPRPDCNHMTAHTSLVYA